MQQAIATCTRAAHLMSIIQEVNAAALVQVTVACCIGHSNGARACHCYLYSVVVVGVVCGGGLYIYSFSEK